jgi:hypothetical protein
MQVLMPAPLERIAQVGAVQLELAEQIVRRRQERLDLRQQS